MKIYVGNELFNLVDGNIGSENLSYAWNDL